MKTRDLIIELLNMDMDAEVDVVLPENLNEEDGVDIDVIRKVDQGFKKFTVIDLKAYWEGAGKG